MKNKFLLIFFSFAINASAQLPSNLPSWGLVAWYPFNGNTNDESGFGNNAILDTNVIITKDRYSNDSSAYHFVGAHPFVIPASFYTPFDSSFTISLWFRSSFNGREQPININDGGLYVANLNFSINNPGGNIVFWNSQGSKNIISGNEGEYTDGFWHNMIFLREDSVVKLYFDGILGGTTIYKLPIGNNSQITLSSGSYSWDGDLDDLAIYNRALSPAEIDTLNDNVNPELVLYTPIATDAYPVGYSDTIRWLNNFQITSLKIEFSIDSGNSWQVIKDSIQASLHSYIWPTPSMPGTSCMIKITDNNDASNFTVSSTFLISRYIWEAVNNNAPFSVRDGAGAFSYKDSMYLVGGWNPTDLITYPFITNNEIWRSADGISWTLISTGPWEPRHTFGTLVYDNKMWIVGGDELQNHWQRDVWNSADGVNWNLLSDSVPWGDRMTHLTCAFDNKLWVMGGQKIVGWSNVMDTVFNDVWNSVDGINWNLVTQHAGWSPRAQIQGQCVFNNKMWVLGGGTYNGTRNYYNDVWNTSDGLNWNLVLLHAPWAARQYHEVMVYDSSIWIIDGFDGIVNRNDVWYSYNGTDWYNLKGTPWPPRHASSVFNHDKSLWLVAGNLWNDVWRLNKIICQPIALQPTDTSLVNGDTATFLVSITNTSSLFQWQIDSLGSWQNLSNNAQFLGSTNDTLTVLNCSLSNNQQHFRCIVTNGICIDSSRVVTLSVSVGIVKLKKEESKNIISTYPNPASDQISVKVNRLSIGNNYQIFDENGKIVANGKVISENFKLNTSQFTSGLYLLKVGDSSRRLFEVQR